MRSDADCSEGSFENDESALALISRGTSFRDPNPHSLQPYVRVSLWLGLAGKEFCGPITDDSNRIDYEMAREYLARCVANPLQAAAELARYRDAARRLVRTPWARHRIRLLPDALLRNESLSGEDIFGPFEEKI
jgi:hypothetical protein